MSSDSARARFEELAATYRKRSGVRSIARGDDGAEADALSVNADVFATLAGDRLAVLLPAGRHGLASEWVSIEAEPRWPELAHESYLHVGRSTGLTQQPHIAVMDPHAMAERVADAFDVGRSTGPMTPVRHVSQETWRLDTASGSFLVKRFWRGPEVPWRVTLEAAMEFEALALRAGIDSPAPVPPRDPQFAAAASIEGLGVFRAYPYLEHRPLEPDDDITDWYAGTLAQVQQLEPPLAHTPAPPWWYNQFPVIGAAQWDQWLDQARVLGRTWADALADRLDLILALDERALDAFADGAPYVMTHRDVETWNILMVPAGTGWRPVLIDWDVAGPDSASLEAAHVFAEYAMFGRTSPDLDRLQRSIDVYHGNGGPALDRPDDILARRLGMRIAHIGARVRSSVTATSTEAADRADTAVADYLAALPTFVADVGERARRFRAPDAM